MVVGICDDERSCREELTLYAQKWQKENHPDLVLSIKSYGTTTALLSDWEAGIHYDLLFLDIRMKYTTGLQLASIIRKTDPYVPIVFITNYVQYATEGYEANAFRFLVKPLLEDNVYPCLEHAYTKLPQSNQPVLFAAKNGAHVRISLQNIVSISCGHHQAYITVSEDSKPYSVWFKGSFDDFLSTIPAPFFIRCHKSHVINAMYVDSLSRNDIRMLNGQSIPISRTYAKSATEHLLTYSNGGLLT